MPQTAAESQIFAPISPPLFGSDLLRTPQAPPPDAASLKVEKSSKAAPAPALPSVGLGNYQLKFDAKNSRDAAKSGLATDSGESANLGRLGRGQKPDPVLPNFFGLKLSTPTH